MKWYRATNFSPQRLLQTEDNHKNETITDDSIDNEFLGLFPDNREDDELESQWKTMSFEEYKKLIKLIPEVEKYRNSAEKKEKIIKSKDSQLKELQKHLKRNWINISHLSAVNISVFLIL